MSSPFKQLETDELEFFKQKGTTVNFSTGELVFKQNTPITQVAFLKTGCLKIIKESPKTVTTILQLVNGPEFLGLTNTFSDNYYSCSAITLSKSEICFIDKDAFNDVLNLNGRFANCMLQQVCSSEQIKFELNNNLLRKQISGRIAQILLYFSERVYQNQKFEIPLSRPEIASFIGISNRSLSRMLGEFKQDGLISNEGQEITLLRKDFLQKLAQQ